MFVEKDYNLNAYYKWRTYSFFNNDSKRTWSQLPFQIVEGGQVYVPPRNIGDSLRLNPARVIKSKVKREYALMAGVHFESDVDSEPEIKVMPSETNEISKGHTMSVGELEELTRYLSGIKLTRQCICEGMIIAIEFAINSK